MNDVEAGRACISYSRESLWLAKQLAHIVRKRQEVLPTLTAIPASS